MDPDADDLLYSWAWPTGSAFGEVSTPTLPLGTTCVTLTARDPSGHIDEDTVAITVEDTTGPELTVELTTLFLQGLKRLVSGEISRKNLGGPIEIARQSHMALPPSPQGGLWS